ncbi:MAG: cation:proton antiporter [Actinomycetota bacterium]
MLLVVEFPPTSAEWTFFVAAAVILLGPLLVERIGLPGIIGVILGGLLVGPFVLGSVERVGVVESLGQLGLLFLMFLAGLELDLDEFAANRRAALTFGAFAFSLPFVLGIALVLPFGYGAATGRTQTSSHWPTSRSSPSRPEGATSAASSSRSIVMTWRHRRQWRGISRPLWPQSPPPPEAACSSLPQRPRRGERSRGSLMTTPRSSSTRVLAATLSRRFSKRATWSSCRRGSARLRSIAMQLQSRRFRSGARWVFPCGRGRRPGSSTRPRPWSPAAQADGFSVGSRS